HGLGAGDLKLVQNVVGIEWPRIERQLYKNIWAGPQHRRITDFHQLDELGREKVLCAGVHGEINVGNCQDPPKLLHSLVDLSLAREHLGVPGIEVRSHGNLSHSAFDNQPSQLHRLLFGLRSIVHFRQQVEMEVFEVCQYMRSISVDVYGSYEVRSHRIKNATRILKVSRSRHSRL